MKSTQKTEKIYTCTSSNTGKRRFFVRKSIVEVGKYLGLPASKVFGVATFYNQFRFQPKEKITYNYVEEQHATFWVQQQF